MVGEQRRCYREQRTCASWHERLGGCRTKARAGYLLHRTTPHHFALQQTHRRLPARPTLASPSRVKERDSACGSILPALSTMSLMCEGYTNARTSARTHTHIHTHIHAYTSEQRVQILYAALQRPVPCKSCLSAYTSLPLATGTQAPEAHACSNPGSLRRRRNCTADTAHAERTLQREIRCACPGVGVLCAACACPRLSNLVRDLEVTDVDTLSCEA